MRRVLVPGGRLGLACWADVAANPGYAAIERALVRRLGSEEGKLPPFALGDAAELQRLIEESGFRAIEVHGMEKSVSWPSVNRFVRVVAAAASTMLGALTVQGDAVLGAMVAEVAAEMRPFQAPDGTLQFPMRAHLVFAHA